eukprot:TRINITY_DN94051_c0_g1_i1.p1 TRINITY_DN94051_c0_g1~~TRINITY_DN94051_c0_g1_i1.p1  ORF type:complete len:299 (+),score=57.87 TRINITY_DN94051_c0_g1_i1:25-897(+)
MMDAFKQGDSPILHPSFGESAEELEACLSAFDLDGYCTFPCFLRPKHLHEVQQAFDARMVSLLADDMEVDLGVNWAEPSAEPFLRTLLDERLLDVMKQLCGMPFVAMRLELFEKRPGSMTAIPWHQDTYTTHVGFSWTIESAERGERPHPVTLWVALDTASRESGGMEMVPGRHRELIGGSVPRLSIVGAAAHGDAVEYRLEAGQAGLHHPLTPHRSLPNRGVHQRRAFLIRFVPWSLAIAEKCTLTDGGGSEARTWFSKPSGRFQWRAANDKTLTPSKALNRLLVCSAT